MDRPAPGRPGVAGWQKVRSAIPGDGEMLLETFPNGKRFHMVCYPFEGRLAHTTLAMLLTRRLDRLGVGPLGFVCNDYALNIWSLRPMDGLDLDELFAQDMLGDDLEAWLDESFMMKRAFKHCRPDRRPDRAPPSRRREVRAPGDLLHRPDLRRAAQTPTRPPDAALRPPRRGHRPARHRAPGRHASRVQGRIRHVPLDRVSPFAVPIMLEIGRERAPGDAAGEMILAEAEEDLIAEAMS
jgi:ATP-dependent Lhr-like helicase